MTDLAAALKRYQGLLNGLSDAAVIVDEALRPLLWNQAYANLAGVKPRRLSELAQESRCCDIVKLDVCERECLAQRVQLAHKAVRVHEIQARSMVAPQEEDLTLVVSALPVEDDEGRQFGVMEIYRDVTAETRIQSRYRLLLEAEKRRGEELEKLVAARTSQLNAKIEELNATQHELQARNAALERAHMEADRIFGALADALQGRLLDGRYLLEEEIGRGSFGAVYGGTDRQEVRPVAVKVFRPHSGQNSTDALERFKLEGELAQRLTHPNAVSVFCSAISEDGIPYHVMELLDGSTLQDELAAAGVFSLARAGHVAVSVCRALQAAHAMGLIHRDIKPANVFVHKKSGSEIIKVIDFGAAVVRDDAGAVQSTMTGTGVVLGTPMYLAPERIQGRPYDGRADVYALANVLYEMIDGRAPFADEGVTQVAVIMAHLTQEPRRLQQVPDQIWQVLAAGLQKDPQQRPSAAEYLIMLETHFPPV